MHKDIQFYIEMFKLELELLETLEQFETVSYFQIQAF